MGVVENLRCVRDFQPLDNQELVDMIPAGSKTAIENPHIIEPMRGHDMSEMWINDGSQGPTESIAVAHIAKLEEELKASFADLAELGATIRRLSDENAPLRDMLKAFVDHEVDYMRLNHLGDPMMVPRIKYAHAAIYGGAEIAHAYGNGETFFVDQHGPFPNGEGVAIYGTDFPECPDASMHQPVEAPAPSALVTRWRNGKRYELTPEDARRFDEGDQGQSG